jgi:hypothetical protein
MGNKKSSVAATNNCTTVWKKEYGYTSNYASAYEDETIFKCRIRSCRILHGSYSWLATFGANILSVGISAPIKHWWAIL